METLEPCPSAKSRRNPHWADFERVFLSRHPGCAVCGIQGPVVAHHIIPVFYAQAIGRPDLEMDERNLVSLCRSESGALCDDHHLYVGHLGDHQAFNLEVREDAAGRFRNASKARLWMSVERIGSLLETLSSFPHLGLITDAQLRDLRRRVDAIFPLRPC
jgi:hypothetical protein